jgi:hypothetical protein
LTSHELQGGRPRRRGDARRAERLRVARAATRRSQYDVARGKAADLPGEVAAASDYLRGALRANRAALTSTDEQQIRRLVDELAGHADRIYARAAKQAALDGNTPRRRRTPA